MSKSRNNSGIIEKECFEAILRQKYIQLLEVGDPPFVMGILHEMDKCKNDEESEDELVYIKESYICRLPRNIEFYTQISPWFDVIEERLDRFKKLNLFENKKGMLQIVGSDEWNNIVHIHWESEEEFDKKNKNNELRDRMKKAKRRAKTRENR